MKTKEFMKLLAEKIDLTDIAIAIQREDGNFDYYEDFGFNPETGDFVVSWEEVKKCKASRTNIVEFPKDYCIKINSYDEFEKLHKEFYKGDNALSDKTYICTEVLLSLSPAFFPMYMHIVNGELESYESDNQSETFYTVDDWFIINEELSK